MRRGAAPGRELLEPARRRVEEELRSLLEEALEGAPAEVTEPCRYAALGPGKRIRPLLFLHAREAAGAPISPGAVRMACSVELIHAYSLIHDDLPCMDDDVLRRGRPAHHVRYGTEVAVVAGALLMPVAVEALDRGGRDLGLSEDRRRRVASVLLRAAGARGMVGGQLRDLEAEGTRPDPGGVEEIYRGKTAALIAAATRTGALSTDAGAGTVDRLGRVGWHLGLAFQVVDDLLDLTGTDRELGKESGRDAALAKATYPAVAGRAAAERRSRELVAKAREELGAMGEAAEPLRTIARFVVERRR